MTLLPGSIDQAASASAKGSEIGKLVSAGATVAQAESVEAASTSIIFFTSHPLEIPALTLRVGRKCRGTLRPFYQVWGVNRISAKTDSDGDLVKLGLAIRAARNAKAISQEALADFAGIDRSHLGRIERGERNITVLNLLRIARSLDIASAEILRSANL